jgi:acetyl-CoA synthetase
MVITDGGFRGNKTIDLKKEIVDEAPENVLVEKVLVAKRIQFNIMMLEGRDQWQPLLDQASDNVAEIMDAEDPLFILYTSGSTGKPKGSYYGRIYGVQCLYV